MYASSVVGRVSRIGLMTVLVVGLVVALHTVFSHYYRQAAPPPVATIDPRLVLHPHTTTFTARVAAELTLRGRLYPTLPGRNTLCIFLRAGVHPAQIRVVATMSSMRMVPVRATLRRQGNGYRGIILLPMFGVYRAQLFFQTGKRTLSGTIRLTLALPL
jgi:hypothetical protein